MTTKRKTTTADRAKYRVLIGINYPDPKNEGEELRAEPGDVVDDIPTRSVSWLLEQGAIERTD